MPKKAEVPCCELHVVHEAAVQQGLKAMPPAETLTDMAELFKLFGDPTRLKILISLSRQELCVCDLAALIGMSESAVSHQLRLLKQGRLVKNRRAGKSVFYSLADDHVHTLLAQCMEHISEP